MKTLILFLLLSLPAYAQVGSLQFVDANNDCIELGTMGNFGSATGKTVTYWVKTTDTSTSSGENYFIGDVNDGTSNLFDWQFNKTTADNHIIQFRSHITGSTSNVAYTEDMDDGEWHFVCTTMDISSSPDDVVVYVDGVSQTLTSDVTGDNVPAEDFDYAMSIGCRNIRGSLGNYSVPDLTLADIRFYTKELSKAECDMANMCRNKPVDGLEARMLFDSTTYTDTGSGANDGDDSCTGCAAPTTVSDSPPTSWCG